MGHVVAAFAVSHSTLQERAFERADPGQAERVQAAWATVRARLEAAEPDAIVVISRDHMRAFFLDRYPTFCLGVADAYSGCGDAGLPRYRVPGDAALSRELLGDLVGDGYDLAWSEDFPLDHGFVFPLHRLRPQMDIPVVPLHQNGMLPPFPSLERCYGLGRALRASIERSGARRVALIASGGLSHWIGVPGMGRVNRSFDGAVLELMAEGRIDELLAISPATIDRELGNGGHELNCWATLLGVTAGRPVEVLAYEDVEPWATGIALVDALGVPGGVEPPPLQLRDLPQPAPETTASYALNRVVYDLVVDERRDARYRAGDREALLEGIELPDEQRRAVLDADFAALTAAGVAPILLFQLSIALGLDFATVFTPMAQGGSR